MQWAVQTPPPKDQEQRFTPGLVKLSHSKPIFISSFRPAISRVNCVHRRFIAGPDLDLVKHLSSSKVHAIALLKRSRI